MDQSQFQSSMRRQQTAMGQGAPDASSTNNEHHDLVSSLDRLSLATGTVAPLSTSSPSLSPRQSPSRYLDSRNPSYLHHDSTSVGPLSSYPRPPRKTPSTSSLRDDRRSSSHSLQKRASVSSLRSVHNASSISSPRPSLSRRSSSNMLSSQMRPKSPFIPEAYSPPPPPTASSIAADHFSKEVALHQSADLQSRTLVILQDSCYGHRYSRPRTSKTGLELIVERPERLHASVLGLATAYVRVGRRYDDGQFAPHPDLDLRSLPIPPFQIRKTTRSMPLSAPAVTHVHGTKWMDELRIMCEAAESRLALNGKELIRPSSSSSGKDDGSAPKLHEGDLYLCPESLSAFEGALGGVCEAVDAVFGSTSTRRAFVCIRPPGHHCSSNLPSGFCWLNNVHVGIAHAAMTHGLTHAAIIDFDLHHGDGSQSIAWEQNSKAIAASRNAAHYKKTAIGYFSLHDINSYPCEGGDETKVRNASVCIDDAHGQSIWNVHLEPWKTTGEFWQLYNSKYIILLEKTRAFLRLHNLRLLNSANSAPPKAAIFLSAGFDASEFEGEGMQRHKVNVPTDFYARFTRDIVQLAEEEGLGADGRIISVLEGGYSNRALASGVMGHLSGMADTRSASEAADQQTNRLASEMFNRLGLVDGNGHHNYQAHEQPVEESTAFDSEWWSPTNLKELETLAYPPPPIAARNTREKGPPTFASPTQSSSAKAIAASTGRRLSVYGGDSMYIPPPLPEVDWATAAFELSKTLIPTDRQTMSWQHSDLKAEATRTRRDRHSTATATDFQQADRKQGMQLRERKPKAPSPEAETKLRSSTASSRPPSRAKRRTTIASVSDLPDSSDIPPLPEDRTQDLSVVVTSGSRRRSVVSNAPSVAGSVSTGNNRNRAPDVPSRSSSKSQSTTSSRTAPASAGTKSADALAVKKSRAMGTPTAVAATRSSPRKNNPPTQRPAAPRSLSAQSRSVSGMQGRSSSGEIPNTRNEQDVDSLAARVNKLNIKLRLPSPEEHAARERRVAEEQRKVVRSSTKSQKRTSTVQKIGAKSATSGPTKLTLKMSKSPEATMPPAQDIPLPSSDPIMHDEYDTPGANVTMDANNIPTTLGLSSPTSTVTPVSQGLASAPGYPSLRTVSPPFTPASVPSATQLQPQITVMSPPPPPYSACHSRDKLPVFTATSAIPFAPANQNVSMTVPSEERSPTDTTRTP
ncbi:hypothetical protein AJ80_09208 [Polytolypa hystricis UAMH7299]|uniref:Histone deacetylase domain-containing protein n=1 Tax=Polytolypa hystricis (strain UAMH7299) TaxID=1447883 RepID=A0A2B7WUD0_POLH7|nr:hypothetical protein AJ80_09208 [Polytolypa hystricis UAMH7299]